jgi:site-specific recombinase XerD
MQGHDSLESTQIYTHVAINDLRAMHKKFHPREQKADD